MNSAAQLSSARPKHNIDLLDVRAYNSSRSNKHTAKLTLYQFSCHCYLERQWNGRRGQGGNQGNDDAKATALLFE
jgi:hypothetical protein